MRLEREAMDTVFAIKQPGRLLTNTASSLHNIPLSLLGRSNRSPAVGKRPEEVLDRGAPLAQNFLQKII